MLQEHVNTFNAAYQRLLESGTAVNVPGAGILVRSARTSPSAAPITPPHTSHRPGAYLLGIDDADQVRSERNSPRGESISPFVGTGASRSASDRDDTHTLPTVLPMSGDTPSMASADEVELYKAAEQVCVLLSGVDYRTVALQSTKACDLVTRMICEEVNMAKRSDWVPSYLVARQADRLRSLFRETKLLLESNGVAVPSALERITSQPPTSPGMANRQRTVSVDASAAGGGRGVHKADSELPQRPLVPAADEAYDVRLMHSAFDDRSDPKMREMEDEVMVLKSRLDKANREKRELQATVERQEQQLVSMRTKLTKDTEVFYQTQRQMQADLRQLAVTTGHRELLNSDDELSPTEQRPSPGPANYARALIPTPPDASVHPPHEHHVSDEDPLIRPTSSTSRPRPTSVPDTGLLQPFAKYNRLDTLYHDVYKAKGMEFLRQAIDVVFKMEYDTQTAPTSTQTEPSTTSPLSASREDDLKREHRQFLEDLHKHVLTSVEDFDAFRNLFADATPLRSEYVAHCMEMRAKPNSGVVALLSTISADSDVVELNLSGNYVGDGGLSPLLPVLQRLYRLRTLRLADNGLKNNAVRALCHAVRTHPSLTALDLAKNNITRAAGRELLGLVASMPKLRVIDVSKTLIDEPLIQKIKLRLELNQTAGGVVARRSSEGAPPSARTEGSPIASDPTSPTNRAVSEQ